MLDGPQALASRGASLRVCERQSAIGKTPDKRPGLAKPFAGFICSSLDVSTDTGLLGPQEILETSTPRLL